MVSLMLFVTYMVFGSLSEMRDVTVMCEHLKMFWGFDPRIIHLLGLTRLSTLTLIILYLKANVKEQLMFFKCSDILKPTLG